MRSFLPAVLCLAVAGCGGAISSGAEPGEDVSVPDVLDEPSDEPVDEPADDPAEDVEPEGEDATVDCTELVWYQDVDHDGFGTNEMTYTGCEPPLGYVEVGGDCNDDDWDVFPGQAAFFTEPDARGSFDYSCDGYEEAESYDLHRCTVFDCAVGEGWNEAAAPGCGESGAWIRCETWGPVCNYQPSRRVQGCR